MENDTLEIKIAKARAEMSQESRQAIDAVSWKQILLGINSKFTPEQLEILETETELLLCGLTSTTDFPIELETRLKIPKNEVTTLLNEMDRLIFKKMQEELESRISKKVTVNQVSYTKKFFIPDPLFSNLPKDLQEAIYYSNWKDKLYNIAKKYNLAVNKMGELETITAKTISGEIKTDQYENEIKTKINPLGDKAKEMVVEINEVVFKNIKDNMQGGEIITDEKTGKIGVPIPPYKVIRNEELKMKNEIANKKMPLPPYVASIKQEVVSSKSDEMSNKDVKIESNTKEHEDMYREHGVDIINNEELGIKNEKEESSFTPSFMRENTTRKEKVPDLNTENIISNKLFNKTTSQTVVTDYSLPKINSQMQSIPRMQSEAPKKPHDPYHEEI